MLTCLNPSNARWSRIWLNLWMAVSGFPIWIVDQIWIKQLEPDWSCTPGTLLSPRLTTITQPRWLKLQFVCVLFSVEPCAFHSCSSTYNLHFCNPLSENKFSITSWEPKFRINCLPSANMVMVHMALFQWCLKQGVGVDTDRYGGGKQYSQHVTEHPTFHCS